MRTIGAETTPAGSVKLQEQQSVRTRVKTSLMRDDKESWVCCYHRLIHSSRPFHSNSSPLKIRCSELFWWLLWSEPVLLQVLHEIARVRWGGLWCFWVNTSSELFGCWSWGAIRPLSVNLTSQRQLSHTQIRVTTTYCHTHSCRNRGDYGLRYNRAHSECWKVSDVVVPGSPRTHSAGGGRVELMKVKRHNSPRRQIIN